MRLRFNPLAAAGAATLALAAHAQAPAATDPPAAPSVQLLPSVFITGSPLGSDLFELADPVNVLQGRELLLKQQPTLGQTLADEVGVSSTYFGPNASRPVIRGLGGFDIRLLGNGLGLLDASSASPDHAVSLDPLAIDRIEVVRGPAALLYGGNAMGGVVNVVSADGGVTAFSGTELVVADDVLWSINSTTLERRTWANGAATLAFTR